MEIENKGVKVEWELHCGGCGSHLKGLAEYDVYKRIEGEFREGHQKCGGLGRDTQDVVGVLERIAYAVELMHRNTYKIASGDWPD